jgi:vacuolar protein sorting-associated protein 13A/C
MSLKEEGSGKRLALLAMERLVVGATLASGGMRISGRLGNLTAQDTYTTPSRPYEMLGLRSSEQHSLLTFEYDSPPESIRASKRAETAYDTSLRMRLSSVRVSYWHPAVMRTWDYLQQGVLGAIMSATASTVATMAMSMLNTEVSAMSLDVVVESPLVHLPTIAGGADGFSADLGRFGVRNVLEKREAGSGRGVGPSSLQGAALLDCIAVTIENMQLSERQQPTATTAPPEGATAVASGSGARLLSDMAFSVSVERGVGLSASRPLVVSVRGGELVCKCSNTQYELLTRVATQNLAGNGDTHSLRLEPALTAEALSLQHDAGGSDTARSTLGHSLTMSFTLELGAVAIEMSDREGALVSTALRRLVRPAVQSRGRSLITGML